ncbi:MAG: nucleotidyl transferase AbiEii/AbiGii toxin family protein [Candidatus Omnitrophica bacterium]|nr:nucleotidyl transferase AbiEii/AbiGii toxin family protein [Candidatus Omnitrophota bacterium]
MLTYDSLIEQAKLKNMPAAKIRGILREYLQVLILKELYRTETGKKIYFTGGTYLRLTHNLKRFSEDLDFNTETVSEKEFESLLTTVKKELNKTGLVSRIEYAYWNNVYAGKLIFPDLEKSYNVVSKYSKKEGIVIKIETNKPAYKIKSETRVISGFGELYPCLCTDKGIIFADKIDALNKKKQGQTYL